MCPVLEASLQPDPAVLFLQLKAEVSLLELVGKCTLNFGAGLNLIILPAAFLLTLQNSPGAHQPISLCRELKQKNTAVLPSCCSGTARPQRHSRAKPPEMLCVSVSAKRSALCSGPSGLPHMADADIANKRYRGAEWCVLKPDVCLVDSTGNDKECFPRLLPFLE